VPSLRNVALTAPYFHDGSIPDLRTAVQTMARLQLNKSLDERTTDQIVAFLQTLTGELPVRSKTFEARR
jgi:cytochrome c peroxidase